MGTWKMPLQTKMVVMCTRASESLPMPSRQFIEDII